MKGITKEIKEEEESWCNNSGGSWKEETTTKTQSHHTAVSRLWMLPLPCSHPRAWMEETHKMKARPCSKPNIQILHNDLVLNSGFMSSVILMAFIVFSRKTLLLNFSAKEGCMPASHLSPSSTCCYTRWDTAKRWRIAVRILPYREFMKCIYLCHHPHFPLPSPQYWSDLEKCTDVHLWMPCYS